MGFHDALNFIISPLERWREATGWMHFSSPSPAGKGGMGQKTAGRDAAKKSR
jgi:hypothetical protein